MTEILADTNIYQIVDYNPTKTIFRITNYEIYWQGGKRKSIL